MVRLRDGCHLSWMKIAGSSCGTDCVPASSTDRGLTPACCKYRRTGPVMSAPDGQTPVSEVAPFEHST
jgi:hypothetical protein